MLTTRPSRRHRVGALALLALLTVSSVLAAWPGRARGDLPVVAENPDATRTVSWTMGSGAGLTLQGVALDNGSAALPWRPVNITWDKPSGFLGNGTVDSNIAVGPTDLSLRADPTNYVADGGFGSTARWSFESSAGGNVTANWDPGNGSAWFRHASPGSEASWDSLDANPATWSGINGVASFDPENPREGSGMLRLNFTLGSAPDSWAGIQRSDVANLSGNDRLVLWVFPSGGSLPVSFRVTAFVGGILRGTTSRPLAAGWQEVAIDLTELGPARESLVSVTLRLIGQNISSGVVYFDDLRLGTAKRFDEAARAWQTMVKVNATSPNPGSAILRVNWSAPTAVGALRATGFVQVAGPSGSTTGSFLMAPGATWKTFQADVSAATALSGLYNLSLGVRVVLDNTSGSSVEARMDDVSIQFPNRRNGTYLSSAVSLGAASEFRRVTWTFEAPAQTFVRARIRTGNDSSPGSPTWSLWRLWTSAGTSTADLRGARFFQTQVDLETENISETPHLRGVMIETRHRSLEPATIRSGLFQIPSAEIAPFLGWRLLRAKSTVAAGTSIQFSIGDGSYWRSVASDGNISAMKWTTIQWSATLSTTDGLASPRLDRVDLVYAFLGDPVRVVLRWPGWPGPVREARPGQEIRFEATALDSGAHLVSIDPRRFDWTVDDRRAGRFQDAGVFVAGSEAGEWTVTATLYGTTLFDSVRIRVVASWLDVMIEHAPPALAALSLGALGYVGYRYGVHRLFKIDDVFLIGKDGRLLMHNTRRIRADRDEDILSGMLTAILSFLKDADPEENGDLKRFEIGGKTTLLERGAHAYLAVVYSGRVPRWAGKNLRRFMAHLESDFGGAFARWSGDPEDLQGLKEYTGRFVSRFRYRPPRRANGRAA